MLVRMKKDTRLTFRVSSHLKKDVEAIATREGQSVARICEAFLWPDRTPTKNNAPNSSSECWGGLVRSQQTDFCEVRGGSPRNDIAEKVGSSVSDRNNPAARSRALRTAP